MDSFLKGNTGKYRRTLSSSSPTSSRNTYTAAVVAGDLVIVNYSKGGMHFGTYYTHGTVLGVGSFLNKNEIHYSIKLINNNIVVVPKQDIQKPILSKQRHIPRVSVNDTVKLKNNCIAMIGYIGKALAMSLSEEIQEKKKKSRRRPFVATSTPKTHENAEKLYINSDDEIYVACQVLNDDDDTINDNNDGGIIDGIRYFYTDSNNKCLLVKASNLTKYIKISKYELLVYGYLSYHSHEMSLHYLHVFGPIIVNFLEKSIGFRIEKLWYNCYSFGTCSVSNSQLKYAVFDIDDNMYGPLIHVSYSSSYRTESITHTTLFDDLYEFESNGEGYVNNDELDMRDIKSIRIKKCNQDEKSINVDNVLSDIANEYNVNDKILSEELKRNNLKLHGINYHSINELSKEYRCSSHKYIIRYINDALIKKITERDKDKIVCFDGNGMVLMANGSRKRICELNIGDEIMSLGNKKAMIECRILNVINKEIEMVKLINKMNNNYFWITFEHPIIIQMDSRKGYNIDNDELNELQSLDTNEINKYGLEWILPKDLHEYELKFQANIYNFILNRNHTINVNGFWCCTLCHDYKGKIIEHTLWGNSKNVKQYLQYHSQTYPDVRIYSYCQ